MCYISVEYLYRGYCVSKVYLHYTMITVRLMNILLSISGTSSNSMAVSLGCSPYSRCSNVTISDLHLSCVAPLRFLCLAPNLPRLEHQSTYILFVSERGNTRERCIAISQLHGYLCDKACHVHLLKISVVEIIYANNCHLRTCNGCERLKPWYDFIIMVMLGYANK